MSSMVPSSPSSILQLLIFGPLLTPKDFVVWVAEKFVKQLFLVPGISLGQISWRMR